MSVDKSVECRQNTEKDLPGSSLCQNGKQVEIITKMIFELCYIEAMAFIITTIETTTDSIVTIVSIVVYIVLLYDRVVLK